MLTLDYESVGNNGTITLTARIGGELLACEKVDILNREKRDAFAARLRKARGDIDGAELDSELLKIADAVGTKSTPAATADLPELEAAFIVRPELFHAADVSGVSVPIRSAVGGEARSRWFTYLRWADGSRERRELTNAINRPDGSRLLVYPVPGNPTPTMTPAWSAEARRAWLSGAPAPNPDDVLRRIVERIDYFIDFAPESGSADAMTLALWAVFTYVYPVWAAVCYLSIGGPLGSGKSTVFAVLSRIIFRPLQSSNMTAACLFRTLHERGGALLLDEAERLKDGTPDAAELRSILLSGYRPGSPAMRLEKVGDSFAQVAFDVYGPKALASIANPPEALASRCIRFTMFRAGPDSLKPRRRLDADPKKWQVIRDDLHALALEHGPIWRQLAQRSDVVPGQLAGREYELWQPLLALAAWFDDAGVRGLLPSMLKQAETIADTGRDDATPEADEAFLRILAEAVIEGRHHSLKAGDVLRRAKEVDGTTFDKWSPKGVGSALARYGLQTTKGRGNAGRTFSKVTLAQLRQIESAYGLDLDLPVVDVPTSAERADDTPVEAPETPSASVHGVHVGTCRYVGAGGDGNQFDSDHQTAPALWSGDMDDVEGFEAAKRAVGILPGGGA